MKMPDDFEDHSSLAPTVLMSILAVTLFVALILVMVLFVNGRPKGSASQGARQNSSVSCDRISGDG